MKIVALGDTHGRVLWEEIVKKNKDANKIIFIGELFDNSLYLYLWKNIKYTV